MTDDNDAFDQLKTSANPAVLVVTAAAEGTLAGCLVGFHSQSSMAPLEYAFWLSKANHTYLVGLRASHFVAHFLTSADRSVAKHFGGTSGHDVNKFDRVAFELDANGTPVLRDCRNRLSLERVSILDTGGDHVCVIAAVRQVEAGDAFEPLRLLHIQDIVPGRDEHHRAVQP